MIGKVIGVLLLIAASRFAYIGILWIIFRDNGDEEK